jgi:hypothetical protein
MQYRAAKAIEDHEAAGAVLCRIDMHAKRPIAEQRVDDPD